MRLSDKYEQPHGRILLSATQALVRLPVMQRNFDHRVGVNTTSFISGYRGSPLGGYDMELWRAKDYLDSNEIVFHPGVNEELAATAVWGTQQTTLMPNSNYDGVTGIWYGKGPGVDRAGDAIKHGNLAGTSEHGGVLLVFGDDHPGKSSTTAHQSDHAVAANAVPILYPATVSDFLEFGLKGIAMSRYSGLWVGLKCVNETVENTATIDIPETLDINFPEEPCGSTGRLNISQGFDPAGLDQIVQRERLPAAIAFARKNGLDRETFATSRRNLGIIAAGKSYLDVMQALQLLGLDDTTAPECGINVYKLGLIWPLDQQGMVDFAAGFDEILVVEEKRSFVEAQVKDALYHLPDRPVVLGKCDESGRRLLPSDIQIDPLKLAQLIYSRLNALRAIDDQLSERFASIRDHLDQPVATLQSSIGRVPYFCSGCPHNTSTKVPNDSIAMSGIGCHTMAIWMNRDTLPPTQMGGEGSNWIGLSPFTSTNHVFQNLGDGTYFHSGILAIRAAIDAGVNVTYKILCNDATAMTGGQPTKSGSNIGVEEILRQVIAEGTSRVVLVSDDIEKYRKRPKIRNLLDTIDVEHRDRLEVIQKELRYTPGTTVIVYDQACAAEKRRRRKRGLLDDPERRIFVNSAVCEGCADCSEQSNCVSVQPLDTARGRKRRIDQSSCNKDFSCVSGFCPSFVSVLGGRPRKAKGVALAAGLFDNIGEPERPSLQKPYCILLTGIGGTGVTTVSAVLGMAAHLEHKASSAYDMTGLAQKGGAVTSHLKIARDPADIAATAIGTAEADLLLGCDLVVSGSKNALATLESTRSTAVVNTTMTPTGEFQLNPSLDLRADQFLRAIDLQAGPESVHGHDFTDWASRLLGDTIGANLMLAGFAYQKACIPISAEAIEQAITLNGVKVEFNITAFRLGRLAAHDPDKFRSLLPATDDSTCSLDVPESLDQLVEQQIEWLTDYQDSAYAQRYLELVDKVRAADTGPDHELTRAVATTYAHLLAYKDEYEVARLYTNGNFMNTVRAEFEGDIRLHFHMAPPFLPGKDRTGKRPRKRTFGPWMMTTLRVIARMRRIRGSWLDVFGRTPDRRLERQLVANYEADTDRLLRNLTNSNYELAVQIASLPGEIRGFGPVKQKKYEEATATGLTLWEKFESGQQEPRP